MASKRDSATKQGKLRKTQSVLYQREFKRADNAYQNSKKS
ncbi:YfhE family protein [Scopulibacillus darangshiensis]|nr:YfhE family protein [Scopulibacillus darangshiensis]